MNLEQKTKGALFGCAIGDALGVPVEFKSREEMAINPITDFEPFNEKKLPPGTFSDDASMTFCVAESLLNGYNIPDMADKFVRWYKEGYWGAHGTCFGSGGTTRNALDRVINGESAYSTGGSRDDENGNGSLMRISPMVFELLNEPNINIRFQKIKEASSITHAHFISVFSCFIYIEFCIELLKNNPPKESYKNMQKSVTKFIENKKVGSKYINLFDRILHQQIYEIDKKEINSNGHALWSLESSLWCFLTTNNFKDAVLTAVNLGGDTDTTAAITGAVAGMFYGFDQLPEKWVKGLVKSEEINALANKFHNKIIE